jgi:MFS family permease
VTSRPGVARGGLLRDRSFRLLWTGETVSAMGNSLAAVAMPLLAVSVLQASAFTVSALLGAAYLPWLVIGLPAGAWVDRLPLRALMISCDVASALLYLSLPAASWLGVLASWQLLVVALAAGCVSVLFGTAYQAYLPALVAASELMEGNARLQGSASAAAIAGRSLVGPAAQVGGAAAALLADTASFLVSAWCLLSIRPAVPGRGHGRPATSLRADIACGLRHVVADPVLRALTTYSAVANLAYSGYLALAVVFLVRVIGLDVGLAGLLLAGGGAGSVLGAIVAGRLAAALGTARGLLLATAWAGLSGLLIPLAGPGVRVAWYLAGAMATAAGVTAGTVIISSFRQASCPPELLGRVVSSARVVVFGAIPGGALLAGGLATGVGVRNALWVLLAGFALSGALLLTPGIRSGRDLPATDRSAKAAMPGQAEETAAAGAAAAAAG